MPERNECPECGSDKFISELNQYEVYEFESGKFSVVDSHFIDVFAIICRECQEEVDEELSKIRKRVMLKS